MKNYGVILAIAAKLLVALPLIAQQGWTQQQLPSGMDELKGVFFIDAQLGWAAGSDGFGGPGVIVSTTDGGANWNRQNGVNTPWSLNAVYFISSVQGWAVGKFGTILRTADGGQSWNVQNSGSSADLVSVHFINANTGWATGFSGFFTPGAILRTDDGGQNWVSEVIPNSDGVEWKKVQFVDAVNGYILGSSGAAGLLRTTDGGGSWSNLSIPATATLTDLHFVDPLNGWVVGYEGTIFKTNDGGANWSLQNVPDPGSPGFLDAVHFSDANTGWAVGGGAILNTTNGGGIWDEYVEDIALTRFYDVHFPVAGVGWAVGFSGSSARVYRYGQGVGIKEEEHVVRNLGVYPNPVVDHALINFTLDHRQWLVLEVLDAQGRVAQVIHAGELGAGEHRLGFGTQGFSAGAYVLKFTAGGRQLVRSVVLTGQ
jgi:photosystem II stability/assembly factor-like uncharacterized protein